MVDTRKIATEYRMAHWTQIMQERQESGLSIKAFCDKVGIHQNVYHYWQRKLRAAAYKQISQVQQVEENSSKQAIQGFTEVKQLPSPMYMPQTSIAQGISIKFANVELIADCSYPPEKLAVLIRALSEPC